MTAEAVERRTAPLSFEMDFMAAWETLNGIKVRGYELDEAIKKAVLWNLDSLEGLRATRAANQRAEKILRAVLDIAAGWQEPELREAWGR